MTSRRLAASVKLFLSALLVILGWLSSVCYAVEYPSKPIANYYVDDANLISPDSRAEVNKLLGQLYKDKGVDVYVVTIPSFAAEKAPDVTIEDYTNGLAEKWGLNGKKDNYSVLFVIARDNKFARFQLGSSWKVAYGAKTQQILDDLVVPDFRSGNFSSGVLKGLKEIDTMVRNTPPNVLPNRVTMDRRPIILFGTLLIVLILIPVLFMWNRSGRKTAHAKPKRKSTPRKKKTS